jgi:D-alanine-D-alanine ligase
MARKRIAVMRGGPGSEGPVSLKTGKAVASALARRHDVVDIIVDVDRAWLHQGMPIAPHQLIHRADVVFNALHGEYGEDGVLQHQLESHGIPYTGAKQFGAALAMHKPSAKQVYKQLGLKTPVSRVLTWSPEDGEAAFGAIVRDMFASFPIPALLKPVSGGSSVGVFVYRSPHTIAETLAAAFAVSRTVLAEEFIEGREVTCAVVEDFRGESLYAPPVVEIRMPTDAVFDYESKYVAPVQRICPAGLTAAEKQVVVEYAKAAHQGLHMRHYSRSDFIVHPRRGVYILETNALPGLTEHSLLPTAMDAVGCSFEDFLDHVVHLALKRR